MPRLRCEITTLTPPSGWTKTITVLALLLVAALVFSYLGAFAATGALQSAGLIDKWPSHADPRPRWMLRTFCILMGGFLLLGGGFRFLSWRQCRGIDATAED